MSETNKPDSTLNDLGDLVRTLKEQGAVTPQGNLTKESWIPPAPTITVQSQSSLDTKKGETEL
jgi:hypothetical protein